IRQRAARNKNATVGQDRHALAEHVPALLLHGDGPGRWVQNRGLQVSRSEVGGIVSRAGDDKYLSVVHQRNVNGIDRHLIRLRLPAALKLYLALNLSSCP